MGLLFAIASWFAVVRHPDLLLEVLSCGGTIVSLARVLIIVVHRKSFSVGPISLDSAARFERLFGRTYIAFAVVLGVFAARTIQVCDVEVRMVMAALIVGYAAGVAAGVALRPRISLTALGSSVLPVALACVVEGDTAHLTLALVLTALLVGGITSMIGRYRWTSETIAMRHLLGSLARHDSLTGLANRLALSETYTRHQGSNGDQILALHCLDLDRFKQVNDQYGHPTGDRLLQMVALRLTKLGSGSDMAVRLGGDEFAFLQAGIVHADEVDLVRRRITRVLSEPYEIDGTTIHVGASVGSALAESSTPLHDLLVDADAASYRAKSTVPHDVPGMVWAAGPRAAPT